MFDTFQFYIQLLQDLLIYIFDLFYKSDVKHICVIHINDPARRTSNMYLHEASIVGNSFYYFYYIEQCCSADYYSVHQYYLYLLVSVDASCRCQRPRTRSARSILVSSDIFLTASATSPAGHSTLSTARSTNTTSVTTCWLEI